MSEAPAAIEARGLRKEFTVGVRRTSLRRLLLSRGRVTRKVVEALRGMDLTVPRGEALGLIGRNGSGKTTLLGLIGRIYRPTAGELTVRGSVAPLLELGAGFHLELTGVENIFLNGVILGLTRRQVAERMEAIIEFAELREFIDAPLRTYSVGMKMRLGFAVATHTDADIILVDEVLAVGDEGFQEKCYARLEELRRAGRTLIVVSHEMPKIRRAAGRVIWLDRGRVHRDGPTEQIVDEYLAYSHAHPGLQDSGP